MYSGRWAEAVRFCFRSSLSWPSSLLTGRHFVSALSRHHCATENSAFSRQKQHCPRLIISSCGNGRNGKPNVRFSVESLSCSTKESSYCEGYIKPSPCPGRREYISNSSRPTVYQMTSFRLVIVSLLWDIFCVRAADPTSCARFWPGVTPGQEGTIKDTCTTWPGFPKTFGTNTVYAAFTEYWRPSLSVLDPILNDALDRSFATYVSLVATNGNYMPDIAIIFTFGDIDSEDFAATDLPTLPGPCQIQVYDLIAQYMNTSPKKASQVIAHEIYHCIQDQI